MDNKLERLRVYKRLLENIIGVCSALFELITGEKPPPASEVLKMGG